MLNKEDFNFPPFSLAVNSNDYAKGHVDGFTFGFKTAMNDMREIMLNGIINFFKKEGKKEEIPKILKEIDEFVKEEVIKRT